MNVICLSGIHKPASSVLDLAKAYSLWFRWFEEDGCPIPQYGEDAYCFFCGASLRFGGDTHEDDCIYIAAKQLVEGGIEL